MPVLVQRCPSILVLSHENARDQFVCALVDALNVEPLRIKAVAIVPVRVEGRPGHRVVALGVESYPTFSDTPRSYPFGVRFKRVRAHQLYLPRHCVEVNLLALTCAAASRIVIGGQLAPSAALDSPSRLASLVYEITSAGQLGITQHPPRGSALHSQHPPAASRWSRRAAASALSGPSR